MSKNTFWIIGLIAMSIWGFSLQCSKYTLQVETVQKKNRISVIIDEVYCTNSKRMKSRLYFKYNNGDQSVILSYKQCLLFKAGDQVELYYSPENDWYALDTGENKYLLGMGGAVIIFLGVCVWLIRDAIKWIKT